MRKLQFVFMTLAVLCFAVPSLPMAHAVASLVLSAQASPWALPPVCAAWDRAARWLRPPEAVARNPGTRPPSFCSGARLAFIESLTSSPWSSSL